MTGSPRLATALEIDKMVDDLVGQVHVYEAWEKYGVGPYRDWVRRVVLEYERVSVDLYV